MKRQLELFWSYYHLPPLEYPRHCRAPSPNSSEVSPTLSEQQPESCSLGLQAWSLHFPAKQIFANKVSSGGAWFYLDCESGEVGSGFVRHLQLTDQVGVGDWARPPRVGSRTEVSLGAEDGGTAGGGVTVRGLQGTLRAGQHAVLKTQQLLTNPLLLWPASPLCLIWSPGDLQSRWTLAGWL